MPKKGIQTRYTPYCGEHTGSIPCQFSRLETWVCCACDNQCVDGSEAWITHQSQLQQNDTVIAIRNKSSKKWIDCCWIMHHRNFTIRSAVGRSYVVRRPIPAVDESDRRCNNQTLSRVLQIRCDGGKPLSRTQTVRAGCCRSDVSNQRADQCTIM